MQNKQINKLKVNCRHLNETYKMILNGWFISGFQATGSLSLKDYFPLDAVMII